jgi:hypothetical protein
MDTWTVASGILLAGLILVGVWALTLGAVSGIAWWSNQPPKPDATIERERRAARMARADMARELRRR